MLLSIDDKLKLTWQLEKIVIKTARKNKVLGATIENKLKFTRHLASIIKNANRKLNGLTDS